MCISVSTLGLPGYQERNMYLAKRSPFVNARDAGFSDGRAPLPTQKRDTDAKSASTRKCIDEREGGDVDPNDILVRVIYCSAVTSNDATCHIG